ncbi:unnamed protein product [Blepharisma stoltei]|uniref:Uncharacterized protein n=1 Tax=Blepharisma stoltei TaxID=1481888 RepID=A0AAU9JVD8_9CILI|nr:unnamed protein product [Blepharisma stoltei]
MIYNLINQLCCCTNARKPKHPYSTSTKSFHNTEYISLSHPNSQRIIQDTNSYRSSSHQNSVKWIGYTSLSKTDFMCSNCSRNAEGYCNGCKCAKFCKKCYEIKHALMPLFHGFRKFN